MSPEFVWWIEIAAKMASTATLVVLATWAAERSGPHVGALIATLPISAGPAFFLVSLDHDTSFVAQAALAGLAINAATMALAGIEASPTAIDTIEYAFLEGQDGVFIETRMGFDVDGVEIKARLDFGAKAIDWRGLYKNPGVALS